MHSTCISWARISPQMSKVFVKLKKSTNTETAMLSSPNWNFTFCHWGHRLPVKALALSTPNIPYQNQITHICRFNEICGQNPKTPVIPEFSLIQSWIFYFTNYTSWCTTNSEYAKFHNNLVYKSKLLRGKYSGCSFSQPSWCGLRWFSCGCYGGQKLWHLSTMFSR